MSVVTEWKNISCVIISGLRGEVSLNEEVIFSIVDDLAKAFAKAFASALLLVLT